MIVFKKNIKCKTIGLASAIWYINNIEHNVIFIYALIQLEVCLLDVFIYLYP